MAKITKARIIMDIMKLLKGPQPVVSAYYSMANLGLANMSKDQVHALECVLRWRLEV